MISEPCPGRKTGNPSAIRIAAIGLDRRNMHTFSRQARWTALMLFLASITLASGCNQANNTDRGLKPIEVVATTPITDQVTDYQDFTGRLDALKTVDIRAKVSGYIME